MLKHQLTNYDFLNVILVLVFTLSAIIFYWIIFKKIEPHQRAAVYYFRLYFLLFALAFVSTIAKAILPLLTIILLAHTLYITAIFAAVQGILIRNGFEPAPLFKNKWLYINVFVVVVLINSVLFHFIYDSMIARLFITTANISIISMFVGFTGFKKKRHEFSKADSFLFNFIIFISALNIILPATIYLLDFKNNIMILLVSPQLIQVFLWTVALAIVILLDMVDWHYKKSIIDKLTQLYNRGYFNQRINNLKMLMGSHENALLFIDIDFFKKINDTYGHGAGDLVIQKVAEKLNECVKINNNQAIKTNNIAARLGGEEFAIFFENIDQSTAYREAEKVRFAIESLTITYEEYEIKTTVSVGVTIAPSNAELDDMLKQADQALYLSKQSGRNKVSVYGYCNF